MTTYYIPVLWEMASTIKIEANSLEEAIQIARDDENKLPLPENGYYIDGSWEVNGNAEDIGDYQKLFIRS